MRPHTNPSISHRATVFLTVFGIVVLSSAGRLFAHCDTLDGPVVLEARTALEKGDVAPLLKWVAPTDETKIKSAFETVLKVRTKGPEAKKVADTYFLETLVRLHRVSEGAPFTGLEPAGTVEPAIAAADKAIAEGTADELAEKIGSAAKAAVQKYFTELKQAEADKDQSIEAGRRYVDAYVQYIHFVEELHRLVTSENDGHGHSTKTKNEQPAANEHLDG